MSWEDSALCREVGSDLFFPPDSDKTNRNAGGAQLLYKMAKRVCESCPVSNLCGESAMTREKGLSRQDRHGVWGGMTPREREALDPIAGTRGWSLAELVGIPDEVDKVAA